MKLLLFLLIFLSCVDTKPKKDIFLILECELESNKPIPVLVFGTKNYSKNFGYSRNFIFPEKIIELLQKCVEKNTDTFL